MFYLIVQCVYTIEYSTVVYSTLQYGVKYQLVISQQILFINKSLNRESLSLVSYDVRSLCTWMAIVSDDALKCFSTASATLCVVLNRSDSSSGFRSRKRSTGLKGHTKTSRVANGQGKVTYATYVSNLLLYIDFIQTS